MVTKPSFSNWSKAKRRGVLLMPSFSLISLILTLSPGIRSPRFSASRT